MRVNAAEPKDPRSTQRKRARKILYESGCDFICGRPGDIRGCGRSPTVLPGDAPKTLELSEDQVEGLELQANHINKDIYDNDPSNLEWLCPLCHKQADSKTEKGVSTKGWDEKGFAVGFE